MPKLPSRSELITLLGADLMHVVDVSDTSADPNGTSKKITADNIKTFMDSGGEGDVIGPASAVDGNLAVFNGTTGKSIQDGGPVPADGDVSGPGSSVDGNIAIFNGVTGKIIGDGGPIPTGHIQRVKLDATMDQVFFTLMSGALNAEFGWDSTASQPYLEEKGGVDAIDLTYNAEQVTTPSITSRINRGIDANFTVPINTRTYFNGDLAPIVAADPIYNLGSGTSSDYFEFTAFSVTQATINAIFNILKIIRTGSIVKASWSFGI